MDTIKDRLIQLAQLQGLSIRAFEEKCGLGRGNISNMGPSSSIGSDKLTKIIATFPGIDIYWVLTGKDSPTEFRGYDGFNDMPHSDDPQLLNKLLAQAEEIGRLKERVKQLEQRLEKTAGDVSTGNTANVG